MSDALNRSVAPFCHSQNHSGSVPVPTIGVSAVGTQESSFAQSQPLVSRKAGAARHCRVGGLDHHHRPGTCPVEPIRVGGRLMWRTADVARVLGLVETPAPPDMAVMVERLDDMVAAQQETNRQMTGPGAARPGLARRAGRGLGVTR